MVLLMFMACRSLWHLFRRAERAELVSLAGAACMCSCSHSAESQGAARMHAHQHSNVNGWRDLSRAVVEYMPQMSRPVTH